jgi:hypothetical protein
MSAIKTALESPETYATVLHAIIRRQYGDDAYDFDPLTVELELGDDFSAEIAVEAINRWSAMQVVMGSDAVFTRLDAFMGVCNSFAEGYPYFSVFDPVTTEEAAWGLAEIALNRDVLNFGYDIKTYLKRILTADGYSETRYPDIFGLVFGGLTGHQARQIVKQPTNRDSISDYISDELKTMSTQLLAIQELSGLSKFVLNPGVTIDLPAYMGATK